MADLLFAMALPVTLLGKLLVALLTFAIGWTLARARGRGGGSPMASGIAAAATAAIVIALEAALPPSAGGGSHALGVLAAIVGFWGGAMLAFPGARRPAGEEERGWRMAPRAALAAGPLLGALLAMLAPLFAKIPPPDRANLVATFVAIGALAGLIGAGIIAAAGAVEIGVRSTPSRRDG
jgi:hypothetical protein